MKKNNIIVVGILALVIFVAIILINKNSAAKVYTYNTTDDVQITLATNPNPLRLGMASFIINVKDAKGAAVDSATVTFNLNMVTMNMGNQKSNADSQGGGQYLASGRISMSGQWRALVTVITTDGATSSKNFDMNIR